MGLFAAVCARGNSKLPLSGNLTQSPLGRLFATYYEVYLEWAKSQKNPDVFLLKYWDMFIENPREGIARIDERFNVYNQKAANPTRNERTIFNQKMLVGELPTHLANLQQVAVIHGFLCSNHG